MVRVKGITKEWCEYPLWVGLDIIAKNVQIHSKMQKPGNFRVNTWLKMHEKSNDFS